MKSMAQLGSTLGTAATAINFLGPNSPLVTGNPLQAVDQTQQLYKGVSSLFSGPPEVGPVGPALGKAAADDFSKAGNITESGSRYVDRPGTPAIGAGSPALEQTQGLRRLLPQSLFGR